METIAQTNQDIAFIATFRALASDFVNVMQRYNSIYEDYQDVFLTAGRLSSTSFINSDTGLAKTDIANAIAAMQSVVTALQANSNYDRLMLKVIRNPQ